MNNSTYLTQLVDWAMAVACCGWDSLEAGVSLCGHGKIERGTGDQEQQTKTL